MCNIKQKLTMMQKTFIILLTLFFLQQYSIGQVQWTYFPENPVISMDTTYMWASVGQPTCIIHNDTIKMWYAVASGTDPSDTIVRGRIHYAWSLDGVNWTKYAGNPVLDIGSPGQWDDEWLDTPEILWDGDEFKLYYYGDSTYFMGQANTNIGLATSSDGINWTKQGIVLQKGNPGDWDGKFIESPAAYYDQNSGVYALWYTGIDTIGFAKIGLAVSPDGSYWIKDTANPCIDVGPFGSWDDMFAAVPAVIMSNGIFEMWYSGVNYTNQTSFIGYATSIDGSNWIKYPGNPVLSWNLPDSSNFWAIDVVWDKIEDKYKLWYEENYIAGAQAIYYASAPRNVLFSQNCYTSISNDSTITKGDTISLQATGGMAYQWNPSYGLSNPSVANPFAFPDTTFTYYVMIVSDSCITKDSVNITVLAPSGIHITSINGKTISIYPNPMQDHATIGFTYYSTERYVLEIYNNMGQLERIINDIKSGNIEIDRHLLPSGIYFLRLRTDKDIYATKKLIIE